MHRHEIGLQEKKELEKKPKKMSRVIMKDGKRY